LDAPIYLDRAQVKERKAGPCGFACRPFLINGSNDQKTSNPPIGNNIVNEASMVMRSLYVPNKSNPFDDCHSINPSRDRSFLLFNSSVLELDISSQYFSPLRQSGPNRLW